MFQIDKEGCAEVWKYKLDPLGATAVFQHGWGELSEVTSDWEEGVMGVRTQLPGPGEEQLRDLDRARGPEEATVGPRWGPALPTSQQVLCVPGAMTAPGLDPVRVPTSR